MWRREVLTFHPLRLFQVTLATSRACAFANEVGVIWFSFLARQDCPVEEAEGQAEMVLTRTLARMRQDHPLIGRVGSSCSFLVVCRATCPGGWTCIGRDATTTC